MEIKKKLVYDVLLTCMKFHIGTKDLGILKTVRLNLSNNCFRYFKLA